MAPTIWGSAARIRIGRSDGAGTSPRPRSSELPPQGSRAGAHGGGAIRRRTRRRLAHRATGPPARRWLPEGNTGPGGSQCDPFSAPLQRTVRRSAHTVDRGEMTWNDVPCASRAGRHPSDAARPVRTAVRAGRTPTGTCGRCTRRSARRRSQPTGRPARTGATWGSATRRARLDVDSHERTPTGLGGLLSGDASAVVGVNAGLHGRAGRCGSSADGGTVAFDVTSGEDPAQVWAVTPGGLTLVSVSTSGGPANDASVTMDVTEDGDQRQRAPGHLEPGRRCDDRCGHRARRLRRLTRSIRCVLVRIAVAGATTIRTETAEVLPTGAPRRRRSRRGRRGACGTA